MQILNRISSNNKINQRNTTNFQGSVIENRYYKNIKKIARKSESYRKILENIEGSFKRFPKGYDLEIDYYKTRVPDTEQLGSLKAGRFNWLDVISVRLKSQFDSYCKNVPNDSNFAYAIVNILNELTNPIGELTGQLFPSLKDELSLFNNSSQMSSELFDKFKQRVIDKKTGKVDKRAAHDIIYYLEEMVEYKKQPPIEVYKFLTKMAEDSVLSKEMAKQFSSNPRGGSTIKNTLIKYLGGGEEGEDMFWTWYYDEISGYRAAYDRYFNEEIWDKATCLTDLVKQSPNLYTAAFRKFVRDKGVEPVLGELPSEFGDRTTFANLIKNLKTLNKDKNFRATNLSQQDLITVDGRNFNVQKIGIGHSAKLKYRIVPQENPNSSYILKFAPYDTIGNTDRSRKFRDNQALRPDMPYTDSLIDFYLKENNCPNAPDIKYFDYEAQAVLYKETYGNEPEFSESFKLNLYRFKKEGPLSDVYKLGVQLNDIWKTNFLIDANGVYKCIDTGHAKFDNIFRPLVSGKHFALANVCGRE